MYYTVTTMEQLAEIKRAAQSTKSTWQYKIKKYCECEMLILVDFAIRGNLTDSQKEVLSFIVDERYKKMKPLIISTNLNINQIAGAVDFPEFPRVTDRFKEIFKGRVVLLDWDSYRSKK